MNRQYTAKLSLLLLEDDDYNCNPSNQICDWTTQIPIKKTMKTTGNYEPKPKQLPLYNHKQNLKELLKALQDRYQPPVRNTTKPAFLVKSNRVSISSLQKQKSRIQKSMQKRNHRPLDEEIQQKIKQKIQNKHQQPKRQLHTIQNSLHLTRKYTKPVNIKQKTLNVLLF